MRYFWIGLCSVMIIGVGWAGEARAVSRDLANCQHPMTLRQDERCAQADLQRAEARLQDVYRALLNKYRGRTDALEQSERMWVAFREAECRFKAQDSYGGSIYPLVLTQCMIRETDRRSAELIAVLHKREGEQ